MSESSRAPFTVHWDVVTGALAHARTGDDRQLLAIWPTPVRADAAFQAAGVTAFGAQDAGWERNTSMTVDRMLAALSTYGPARLLSVPAKRRWPLYLRLFISEHDLPVPEQVKLPMFSATASPCEVAFGAVGVSLRTGSGRAIWWVELPISAASDAFVAQIAGGLPVVRTSLAWEHLLRTGCGP
jgi:hypothetical protein